MGYDELKRAIEDAPMTWIPALLVIVVTQAVRRNVFQEGGLLVTVEKAMAKARDGGM